MEKRTTHGNEFVEFSGGKAHYIDAAEWSIALYGLATLISKLSHAA